MARDDLETGPGQVLARDEGLILTMKRVGAALKRTGIPFALAGGFAAYAHGGTSSDHDVDFLLRPEDVDAALEALAEAGFDTERPPEDWLVKVYDEGRLVDLIHHPVDRPVTDRMLTEDTDPISVSAIKMPVVSATVLMEHRLLSFDQHSCDFAKAIPLARSLREQIDWPRVRRNTGGSPYAQAFLVLLDRLDVVSLADTRLDLEGITDMIEADRRAALVPVPASGGGHDEPAG